MIKFEEKKVRIKGMGSFKENAKIRTWIPKYIKKQETIINRMQAQNPDAVFLANNFICPLYDASRDAMTLAMIFSSFGAVSLAV